jgi:uncharacterized protein YcfJ
MNIMKKLGIRKIGVNKYENNGGSMKYFLVLAIIVGSCSPALAETVVDKYKTVTNQVPYTENVCQFVDVPIYGNTGTNNDPSIFGLDLEGAIIGGIIGNNVTKNVDNGGAAGAIIGGLIGSEKKKNNREIIGYRQEQQCNTITRYRTETSQVYSHSIVRFTHEGKTYSLRFQR